MFERLLSAPMRSMPPPKRTQVRERSWGVRASVASAKKRIVVFMGSGDVERCATEELAQEAVAQRDGCGAPLQLDLAPLDRRAPSAPLKSG